MIKLTYPLKRQINREVFTQLLSNDFPQLRGNVEYNKDKVTITFIHNVTNAEKQRLDNKIMQLNKTEADWREELKNAIAKDKASVAQPAVTTAQLQLILKKLNLT